MINQELTAREEVASNTFSHADMLQSKKETDQDQGSVHDRTGTPELERWAEEDLDLVALNWECWEWELNPALEAASTCSCAARAEALGGEIRGAVEGRTAVGCCDTEDAGGSRSSEEWDWKPLECSRDEKMNWPVDGAAAALAGAAEEEEG
jgi:hypothetical protein